MRKSDGGNWAAMKAGLYPFWFWNGEMKETELKRQLLLFHSAGCSGVVIHCRTGNVIPYLSSRWMALCRFTCEEAKALGLRIWLYDENGFPSGNANGEVLRLRPDLCQKTLHFEYSGSDPENLASYSFLPGTVIRVDERELPAGTRLLRFFLKENPRQVDTLNREAGELFVTCTHERYQKALGDFFGDPIDAFYTDDESWIMCTEEGLAWSPVIEDAYFAETDHHITEQLPLLVEDLPGFEQVRMDYRSTVEELFLRNFIQVQRDWCHRNGLIYTGHLCGDEGTLSQAINRFGSHFSFLQFEDIPAVDDFLCDLNNQRYLGCRTAGKEDRYLKFTDSRFSPLMLYKFASSTANQFKNGLFSCECLTFLGWARSAAYLDCQMRFEIGMGVNLFTPHAFYYTVGGNAREDCPPSYFFQQPGFDHFGELFAIWTHSAELLRRGKFHADVLLLIPAALWKFQRGADIISSFTPEKTDCSVSVTQVEEILSMTTFELVRRHIGVDYGSERELSRKATVENGCLKLGNASYSTVILPADVMLTPEFQLLLDFFRGQNGNVISSSELDTLTPDIELSGDGAEEILVHTRDCQNEREFYLVNLSGRPLSPSLNWSCAFKLYNPETRKAVICRNHLPEGFTLRPGGSCFILPESFPCEVEDFEHSLFDQSGTFLSVEFISAQPCHENILPIPLTSGMLQLSLPEPLLVRHVYGDSEKQTIWINDHRKCAESMAHHPADICYPMFECSSLLRPGENEFRTDGKKLYLAGNFRIQSEIPPVITTPSPVHLGDLSAQGYPFYWGKFVYDFRFHGKARFVVADMDGTAEIWINGHYAGTSFSPKSRIAVSHGSVEGENSLMVIFANTPQNFLGDKPVPFGLRNCMLYS